MKTARLSGPRKQLIGVAAAWLAMLAIGDMCVSAHPLSQGRIQLVINRDKITLWASVAVEQVVVQQSLPANDDGLIVTQSDAYRAHGKYLLKHIYLSADGKRLEGRVVGVQEPDNKTLTPGDPGKEYAVYELEYTPPAPPALIELRQDVLLEVEYTAGNPWQSTYITGIRQGTAQGLENLLLSSSNTLKYECHWNTAALTVPAQTTTSSVAIKQNIPPDILKQPIPEPAPSRSHFIAGVTIGLCAIYALGMLLKRWRR